MRSMNKFSLAVSALAALSFAACINDTVKEPDPVAPVAADTAYDVFALLPATGALTASNVDASLNPVATTYSNLRADSGAASVRPAAYFDLDAGVALDATGDTSAWDIAITKTSIRVNGQYQLLDADFDALDTAPDDGYTSTGSPSWYNYDMGTNIITPLAGKVLVVKTSGDKYVKIKVLSYYKNSPASPVAGVDTSRYYTFKYFIQKSGTKNLKTYASSARKVFYSLRTGQYSDSTSQWDVSLSTTKIGFNGDNYQVVDAANFDSVKTAPVSGYTSGNPSWYDYDTTTNTVHPKAGKVIVFKTADNKYGKVQVVSYYKGNPASPTSADTSRYYTFKYFVQKDGSTNLTSTGNAAPYTYYSLRTKSTVADSSAQWDIAFRSTSIKVNGSAQIVTANFDTLKTAPATGYAAGSVGTWYDYSGEPNHLITPQLGKVILVKTVDNKYAKVQILNYYQGAPAVPNGLTDTPRYFTFRYVLQADGTTNLQ
jgi:hypothetical protein